MNLTDFWFNRVIPVTLIFAVACAILAFVGYATAYYTPQLDFTIESPQEHVAMWDEYTIRVNTHTDKYRPIETADVKIKIRRINEKYGSFEGTTQAGFLAAPFLIRDYEYRTQSFYNVSVTVNWNDQSVTKYTGFWVHLRMANG